MIFLFLIFSVTWFILLILFLGSFVHNKFCKILCHSIDLFRLSVFLNIHYCDLFQLYFFSWYFQHFSYLFCLFHLHILYIYFHYLIFVKWVNFLTFSVNKPALCLPKFTISTRIVFANFYIFPVLLLFVVHQIWFTPKSFLTKIAFNGQSKIFLFVVIPAILSKVTAFMLKVIACSNFFYVCLFSVNH